MTAGGGALRLLTTSGMTAAASATAAGTTGTAAATAAGAPALIRDPPLMPATADTAVPRVRGGGMRTTTGKSARGVLR